MRRREERTAKTEAVLVVNHSETTGARQQSQTPDCPMNNGTSRERDGTDR